MRNFTLVMDTFNLEVEEHDRGGKYAKRYSAKCVKVGFSVENHLSIESILFPFCEYLAKKQLRCPRNPSKLIYKGFTLEFKYHGLRTYVGACKEIEFEGDEYFDELVDNFLDKVDKHLENTMKTFSVVYNDFTLEAWQEKEKTTNEILWHGKCEAINFEESGYHYLDTLVVSYFQEAVDEYSKPTKIEYKGYELEITQSDGQFEGKSIISGSRAFFSSSKEKVIETLKKQVDYVEREKLISTIKKFQTEIASKKNELENYVRKEGYISCNSEDGERFYVHPDYYNQDKRIPDDWAIIHI